MDHIVITKYRWTANTPRAHITNQRTVEIMRDLGIEDDILANGTPQRLMGDTVFCTSLAGDEIGRVRTWGTHPRAPGRLHAGEPDRALRPAADAVRADPDRPRRRPRLADPLRHRVRGLVQDEDGVTVTVRDRLSGHKYEIRAKYVIGADGGRSKVAADVGLPFEGQMDVAGSMNIVFHADLASSSSTARASCTGCCSPARTSAASAWASCAWCARGTSG